MTTTNLRSRLSPLSSDAWIVAVQRNGWVAGVWALLGALVLWYAFLIPSFGASQISSITKNSLPLIFLAVGQAIIVIAGGVDLSMGALMLLSSVTAARFMDERSLLIVGLVALFVIVALAAANGLVGYIITVSGVPDIVATLATSFIWSGVALRVLPSPGGGTHPTFRRLFTGSEVGISDSYVMPVLIVVGVSVGLVSFMRRTRPGLSIYAIGSDRIAASLAGIGVARAKVLSYALGGAMAGMAGLASVAVTGTGDPRFSIGANATLNSVAAVVLGGVALTGGIGSVLGVVAAAITLVILIPVLSAIGVDSNNSQVIQGLLIAGVMMIGGLVTLRRERRS